MIILKLILNVYIYLIALLCLYSNVLISDEEYYEIGYPAESGPYLAPGIQRYQQNLPNKFLTSRQTIKAMKGIKTLLITNMGIIRKETDYI